MRQDDPAVVITQILGRVSSADALVLCEGEPLGNASRWVFDVQQTVQRVHSFSCRLLGWSGRRAVSAPVMSFYLGPLSASFWDARVFLEPSATHIKLVAAPACAARTRPAHPPYQSAPILYRVAIDLVHSTSR